MFDMDVFTHVNKPRGGWCIAGLSSCMVIDMKITIFMVIDMKIAMKMVPQATHECMECEYWHSFVSSRVQNRAPGDVGTGVGVYTPGDEKGFECGERSVTLWVDAPDADPIGGIKDREQLSDNQRSESVSK